MDKGDQIGMTGSGKFEKHIFLIQQTAAEGDETVGIGVSVEFVAQLAEKVVKRGEVIDQRACHTPGHGSQHTGRDTFAACIGNDHQHPVIVDTDEVIKVTVDLFGTKFFVLCANAINLPFAKQTES